MTTSAGRRGETALVTGASAGIGRELARAFAAEGFDLVLVARNAARLEEVAAELRGVHGVEARVVVADLASPGGPEGVHRQTEEAGLEIDVLVNNAGVGHYSPFAETDLARHLEIVRLNVVALTAMTSLFVRPMVARCHGRILNLSSVAASQ